MTGASAPVCGATWASSVCEKRGDHFCDPRADRAQAFFEKILVHTKGRHAGKPFILDAWQRDEIVRPMFGQVIYDGDLACYVRLYQLAWIELARKNGKSELLSGFALYMLCADGEESAEVYSVACDRDQASLVFNVAKRMVELSPALSARLTIVDSRKRIIDEDTNSVYAVLPGDAGGALGTNPSAVLFDEVLTQRDRQLWDAMRQGFGTRSNPFMVAATTASYTSAKFCLEEHEFSQRVADNPALAPRRFVFMRNTPKDADWRDERNWYHANPALGSFLNINSLRAEAKEAEENPQAQNAFRVFRLNQWVAQANRWLDMGVWRENGEAPTDWELMGGRSCVGGLDLASTTDFAAWCLLFRGSPEDEEAPGHTALMRFWVPRAALRKRSAMTESFELWEADGWLTVHEGDTLDYDAIERDVAADAEDFVIRMFGYDPWNAVSVVQHLEAGGMTAVKVPQTTARLNDPSKAFERAVIRREFYHGDNPVLSWMADNVETEATPEGLIKPSKKRSSEKIDGIAAIVNAMFCDLIPEEDENEVSFISFLE